MLCTQAHTHNLTHAHTHIHTLPQSGRTRSKFSACKQREAHAFITNGFEDTAYSVTDENILG